MQGSQAPNQLQSREIILFIRNVLSLKVSIGTANENIFVFKLLLQLKLLYLELAIFSYDLFRFSDIRNQFWTGISYISTIHFIRSGWNRAGECLPEKNISLVEIIFDAVTVWVGS